VSTPEKPRPSYDDTLARIDQALAETVTVPRAVVGPAEPRIEDVLLASASAPEPAHLPGAPGPTCPGCAADAARPGWLARALNRLFT
jgi:hypothetical protein